MPPIVKGDFVCFKLDWYSFFCFQEKLKTVLDFQSIELQKESFIDDKLRLKIADLLYAVKFEGRPGYLYLLFEHASSPDRLFALSDAEIYGCHHGPSLDKNSNQRTACHLSAHPLYRQSALFAFHGFI